MDQNNFKKIACQVSGLDHVEMSSTFMELEIESTQVVEMLIECEIILGIDLLEDELNLDDMRTLEDAFLYVTGIVQRQSIF
ncbi:MAG: phosphopantetheine-binding protein [Bacillota bacterium]